MNDSQPIDTLEQHVEALLRLCSELKKENAYLRTKQTGLIHERNQVLNQNRKVAQQVQRTLKRLKSMETADE